MPTTLLLCGNERRVLYWALNAALLKAPLSNCPDVTASEKLKIARICRAFIETGHFSGNKEKFKRIEGHADLFAIKSHQLRLLGVFNGRSTFVVLLCLRKKTDKYRPRDLKRVLKYRDLFLKEQHDA